MQFKCSPHSFCYSQGWVDMFGRPLLIVQCTYLETYIYIIIPWNVCLILLCSFCLKHILCWYIMSNLHCRCTKIYVGHNVNGWWICFIEMEILMIWQFFVKLYCIRSYENSLSHLLLCLYKRWTAVLMGVTQDLKCG